MAAPVRSPSTMAALYRLFLRSLATKGRLAALAALAILPVFVGLWVRSSTDFGFDRAAADLVSSLIGLALVVPVVTLVFASAAFGDLRDDETMVYLWLRPTPRWAPVLAAYAATLTVALPFAVVPMGVAAGLIASGTAVAAAVAATALATTCYAALFLALGLRVKHALIWGLAYILIWEGAVASIADITGKLAVRTYARSALAHVSDLDLGFTEISMPWAVLVPLAAAVVALAYTVRRFGTQDVA